MSVAICIVGLAALGVFVVEVFTPRHRREERARVRRERRAAGGRGGDAAQH
ncbi:hypothetical protein [Curtobacterium sp. Leaf261]|uniref:hypothetical protein n=1 Tax=Curtobacterium sp. Leaf261 TaxID=1736311 RepID=UPI000AF4CFD1|nr:hypothetical protein [Curtobacterium sp. Leaf261]